VRFSDLALQETLWCVHPLDEDSKLRMELGVDVRLKTPLLIRHNLSGQSLSYESLFSVMTYFGCEMEVTLDTKLDQFKRPSFENIWYFDTTRGMPKEKDPCARDFAKQAEFSAKINVNMGIRSAAQSAKEEAAAAAAAAQEEEENEEEEKEEDDEDDDENKVKSGKDEMPCVPINTEGDASRAMQYFLQQQQQDGLGGAEEMMGRMSLGTRGQDGYLRYDPATAPQPHAWRYTVQNDDRFPHYPNKKWNCADTSCCYPAIPTKVEKSQEECQKCCEPGPLPNNPNAVAGSYLKRLLM